MPKYKLRIIQGIPKKTIVNTVVFAYSDEHAQQVADEYVEEYKSKYVYNGKWIKKVERIK